MKKGTKAEAWDFNTTMVLESPDSSLIVMLYRALKPLEKELRFHRGFSRVRAEDGRLVLEGYARDVTSLRSVINGLLKCLYLSYMVMVEDLRVNK
ncbi:MAG: hypothetical protein GXO23_06890 [Crenarchaeota archaeon]|nr:hypothetical protein [Thermoproteota archaeon]